MATTPLEIYDFAPGVPSIYEEVMAGLRKTPKEISALYSYDERGAHLFEDICRQPEYYLGRTEIAILEEHIDELAAMPGGDIALIEYGSGSSRKTRVLLDRLPQVAAYVPIDISKEMLVQSAAELAGRYRGLSVLPVCADYDQAFELPPAVSQYSRRLFFYPGSTIGNRMPDDAGAFLRRMRTLCGSEGALLIGVDLRKDPALTLPAYDDAAGISPSFNLNSLSCLNRELGADFDLARFQHHVCYNEREGRVEISIVSREKQVVHLQGTPVWFEEGEKIWRAYAYKYSVTDFQRIAGDAGWRSERAWTDERQLFSVQYFTAA